MKLLLMTGSICPTLGHNANLLSKLIPFLSQEHEVHILSPAMGEKREKLPDEFKGVPIHWATDEIQDLRRTIVYPAVAKLVDNSGYSDYLQAMILQKAAKKLRSEYRYDAVITTTGPFVAAVAAIYLDADIKKVLYIMDPPECTWGNPGTAFRNRKLAAMMKKYDVILSTAFAKEALVSCGFGEYEKKIAQVAFPMIERYTLTPTPEDVEMDGSKINLLFCGNMDKTLQRSPQYYLDIASKLDERFCLYFMGGGCENIREEYGFGTDAQVIELSRRPYQTALNAMHKADVLINIGNSVRVHLPSKIMEYISTCKPIVNFYKFDECPTLSYTCRYPLCLDMCETEPVTDETVKRFVDFCIRSKGKNADMDFVEDTFAECTPRYIAQQILDKLGEIQ